MKVAIQTYKNTGHKGRGIGVYGEELIKTINKIEEVELVEFGEISEIKDKKVDLVHFLHFDLFAKTLPAKLASPMVVTVHDVTPLVFPEHYPSGIKGKIRLFWQKNSLKKAAKVLTISEASKKDIVKYLGITEEKIIVVYSGVSERFKKISDKKILDNIQKKYNLPERFAFYSGNVNWNKNILNTALACIESDLDLVIVGKSFESRENLEHPEMRSFKSFLEKYSHNPKIHILGYVPDEDMVVILNQAELALFVSFYEGFGFPILEAQACGVAVITSNVSSMPEISGEGALLVNPNNIEEIKYGINKLTNDLEFRNKLIEKGFENVKKFSWEKCGLETVEVYLKIVK